MTQNISDRDGESVVLLSPCPYFQFESFFIVVVGAGCLNLGVKKAVRSIITKTI